MRASREDSTIEDVAITRVGGRCSRCLLCLHPVLARSTAAVGAALEDHWRGTHPEAWATADQGRLLGIIWGA